MNLADPVGLLAMGCPPDEYDIETTLMTACLVRAESEAALRSAVHNVFVDRFDPSTAGRLEQYSELAAVLWNIRNANA